MLTEDQTKHFKNLLQQNLDELLAKSSGIVRTLSDPKDFSYELADQASMEAEVEYSTRIKERESRLIVKIKEALERIEEGTFGICEECGEEIGFKRLTARPVATHCIQCKTRQERNERQRGI
jgi:DnaK suppressor protein